MDCTSNPSISPGTYETIKVDNSQKPTFQKKPPLVKQPTFEELPPPPEDDYYLEKSNGRVSRVYYQIYHQLRLISTS